MSNNNYQTSSLHTLKKNKKCDMGSYSYTKLSNYLLDEYILEKNLSAFDIVILIRIVRNTLGFQKLSAKISIPQLSKETKIIFKIHDVRFAVPPAGGRTHCSLQSYCRRNR